MDKDKILFRIFNFIYGLYVAISIIAISTIMALNFRFLYKFIIKKYSLVNVTGLSSDILIFNYNKLINYLQNPFDNKLELPNFTMSNYGRIHFYEVKKIFLFLIFIGGSFIFFNIIYISIGRIKNKKRYKISIVKNLNFGANILTIFFIIVFAAYIIDFSKAFILFHKILFRNNYWIFDSAKDPIINALPEELFMIYGAIILVVIIINFIIIKIISKRNTSKSVI